MIKDVCRPAGAHYFYATFTQRFRAGLPLFGAVGAGFMKRKNRIRLPCSQSCQAADSRFFRLRPVRTLP